MKISTNDQNRKYKFPIWGNGANISNGAGLVKGTTAATNNGALMQIGGSPANLVAILTEPHVYATSGDTLTDGTKFVTHECDVLVPTRIVEMEYSLATADTVQCTQVVNTTTITLANLENNIQTAFLYVAAGTGVGQTNFLTASASGSATLKAAFAVSLDITSYLVKVIPRFNTLLALSSDGTRLASTAAAGTVTGTVLDSYIDAAQFGGGPVQLDPTKHSASSGLNNGQRFRILADVVLAKTMQYLAS